MTATQTRSSKRKGKSHYVVEKGWDITKPTIFTSWDDVKKRTERFSGPKVQGFHSKAEAEDYISSLNLDDTETSVTSVKGFYAVVRGRKTGVFTSWAEAHEQINGFSGNCHQKFHTEEEARRFVDTMSTSKARCKISQAVRGTPSKSIPRENKEKGDVDGLAEIFIQINL
ncbi:unnamed protein product [Clonostachys rosea]|uniref:Ribonuclease H1 N-terminal domain-containing protein n=1 Tax=Bionectria ochroleuca TaxID=29856 RepID=A0ABY6UJR6_BIOOC|nr:unnamed protein product [Clonostachys rosea]